MRHGELGHSDAVVSSSAPTSGLAIFTVSGRAAHLVGEAVAGIARGIEVLAVVPLSAAERVALGARLGSRDPSFPGDGGEPHVLIVASDVPSAGAEAAGVEQRLAEVQRHSLRRVLRAVAPDRAFAALRLAATGRTALDVLALLDDPALPARVLSALDDLAQTCAVPFPLLRMLAPGSPGYRARIALVDHPTYGRSVCKIFRPGARTSFARELHARRTLADQPLVPRLLAHGENWLLTPEYSDDGSHLLRRLPGVSAIHQLRPAATRALARFVQVLHERGFFVLDLSPHNLMSDPVSGLKVLDLEFVMPYADFPGPAPAAGHSWSVRGVPDALRTVDLPELALTRGVGNSVFHPAVAGLPVERLLGRPRRGSEARRVVTQWSWYAAMATAGRLHAAVRRRGGA